MKFALMLLILLLCCSEVVSANPGDLYSLQMEIGLNGNDAIPAGMTVKEGVTGKMRLTSQDSTTPLNLEVTVTPVEGDSATSPPQVSIAYRVFQDDKLVSDPVMRLALGAIGTLSFGGAEKGAEGISLRVSVARASAADSSKWAQCESKGAPSSGSKDLDCCQVGCTNPPGQTLTCCNACCQACGVSCCPP